MRGADGGAAASRGIRWRRCGREGEPAEALRPRGGAGGGAAAVRGEGDPAEALRPRGGAGGALRPRGGSGAGESAEAGDVAGGEARVA